MKFVGRYERLEEDFRYVRHEIGLPERPLRWTNRGASRDRTPRSVDLSAEDRAYLAARFADDFRRFGYEP